MNNLLQFFEYKHLPPHLQETSELFHSLAHNLANSLPPNPESTTALRKLLEAKDCAVRAKLYKQEDANQYKKPNTVTYEKVSEERPTDQQTTHTFKD